jgi:4-hydroxy-3-methylbut-2-enyl diphosphate reductase
MKKSKLEIILSEKMGFCFGVKKSLELANKAFKKNKKKVYMLNPIIHNPQVIEYFREKGAKIVNSLDKIPDGSTLITRAHGIPPSVIHEAIKKKLFIVDTTCPYVKKVQKIASYLNKNNYFIIIFGDRLHPEILSVLGTINNNALVINRFDEIKDLIWQKKIGLISQTTKNINDFKKLSSALLDKTGELRIFNTICKATTERQISLLKLTKKVDIMIVIGGNESANTSRLAEISQSRGVKTYHIETKKQLKYEWFNPKDRVGITSGASTPDWVTKEVIKKIKKWYF